MDQGLRAGDVIKVGKTVELECLDTPGHTMSHICIMVRGDTPALFCGDTLFNAGAGNCHNGGHPNELYNTFVSQLSKLPEETLIYPGHDYIARNLAFTLDREPDNAEAKGLLPQVEKQNTNRPLVTTLAVERDINTFFRLTSPTVIRRLREAFPDLPDNPDQKAVFLKLRELRNKW
jgi:hydroxyacylglutathione hydrolase